VIRDSSIAQDAGPVAKNVAVRRYIMRFVNLFVAGFAWATFLLGASSLAYAEDMLEQLTGTWVDETATSSWVQVDYHAGRRLVLLL
jgi:hypothetical protein